MKLFRRYMSPITNKLLIFGLSVITVACTRERSEDVSEYMKFNACSQSTTITKTDIGDRTENGTYPVLWSASDKIAIVSASEPSKNSIYTTSDDKTATAEFHYDRTVDGNSKLGSGSPWAAFYPASAYSYADGKHNISFSDTQVYTSGSFQSGAMPMIAISDNTNLSFKNLCGVLRVIICTSERETSIKRMTISSRVSLCGKFTTNSIGDALIWEPDSDSSEGFSHITLDFQSPVQLTATPEEFYLVVPPVSIPDLTMELQIATGQDIKSVKYTVPETILIERSKISSLSLDLTQFSGIAGNEVSVEDPVLALTDLSYSLSCTSKGINVFKEGGTGTVGIKSICHQEYADGTSVDSELPVEYEFSTDGGETWTTQILEMFSQFSIGANGIDYSISADNKNNDCMVKLVQKESGKSVTLHFRQSCNAIVAKYRTDTSGSDSLLCNVLNNNVYSLIFESGEEHIIPAAKGVQKIRARMPAKEINQVILRLKDEEISLKDLFALGYQGLAYRLISADLTHIDMARITSFNSLFYSSVQLEECIFPARTTETALTDMSLMFYNCPKLSHIDLSTLNTEKVTDMGSLFSGCSNLVDINLSGISTGNVSNFSAIFCNCRELSGIDVSGFDTRNAVSFARMFYSCSSLTEVDVSGFRSENVLSMSEMFRYSSIGHIDISNFIFENTVDIGFMFATCRKLKSINITEIVAPKLKNARGTFSSTGLESLSIERFVCGADCNLYEMFGNNTYLSTLSLPDFDASNATNMYRMFYMGYSLTELDCSGFKTDNVTNMDSMFAYCTKLERIDISSFCTKNVTTTASMFSNTRITTLDLSSFDTGNVTDMSYMFSGCRYLTSLDLSSFNVEKVSKMSGMFSYCDKLTELNISGFHTPALLTAYKMFSDCENLLKLDLSGICTEKVTDMARMFENCSTLLSIDVSKFSGASLEQAGNMFAGCSRITDIDLRNLTLSKIKKSNNSGRGDDGVTYMFNGCHSLKTVYMDLRNASSDFNTAYMFADTYDGSTIYVKDGVMNSNIEPQIPDSWTVMPF